MKAPKSMRIWFAFVGAILWAGIYLTGFSTASWLLYIPATGFIFAAITGLCLSLTGVIKMLGIKLKETPDKQPQ
jgi:predicted phage tail protein